ncbi:MAG: ABC transporter ATP-binding protein [Acidimicrobiia bacterium]|nr:ABC transporter ATP-binding protein [Acidimicrobiia bacterium]
MLKVEGLRCNYGTASILEDVSIEVRGGEVLALLGRNGMGKTTLVRALAGIDPPQVMEGSVKYRDEELLGLESYEVSRKGIGYVPQGRHVFGSLTVLENLEIVARPGSNGGEPWTVGRVFDFFPRLAERKTSYARNLSGGEQQMLAIARGLMTNPTLLLMDEPSEGLAPIVLKVIRERLEGLKGSTLSILLVEQNLGLAKALGDRINIMAEHGQIVWQGSPAELDADQEATHRHLGV